MWRALVAFKGAVDGAEVQFQPGDEIREAAALEMGLADKPDLATAIDNGKEVTNAPA